MDAEKRAAFKVGFLMKLAEDGISPDTFFKRASSLVDSTLGGIADVPKNLWSTAMSAGSTGFGTLGGLAIQAPLYAGSALGSAHAAMEAPSDSGIKALQRVEELETLRRLTRGIHERRKRHFNV